MRFARIALIVVAVICFGVALSYPIRYYLAQRSNDGEMQELSDMRARVQEASGVTEAIGAPETPEVPEATETAKSTVATDNNEPPGATEATNTGEPPDATEAVETAGDGDKPVETAKTEATAATDTVENPEEATPPEATEVPAADSAPEATSAPSSAVMTTAIEAAIASGKAAMTVTAEPTAGAEAPDSAGNEAPDIEPSGQTDGGAVAKPVETGGETSTQPSEPAEAADAPGSLEAESAPEATVARATPPPDAPDMTPTPVPTPSPTPGIMDLILDYEPWPTMVPIVTPVPQTPDPARTPTPAPTFDLEHFTGALPYPMKEKVELDEDAILPELKEIYELNHDLVGWIRIPDTVIDYPVVQRPEDSEFYLSHDFYGEENQNGQIILDPLCDPYTPSYNLVISGHHMKNGSMFGSLPDYYINQARWQKHMFLEFDTLMERKQYVVFAAFYSADYDEDEEGFRYNVNVRYRMDADPWIKEIRENQLYDTGIDVKFGDEFITLTTCNRARHRNGRFVVVCRRIREGETFE